MYHKRIPSPNALRARLKRVRRAEMPLQPQTIVEINILTPFTLNDDENCLLVMIEF